MKEESKFENGDVVYFCASNGSSFSMTYIGKDPEHDECSVLRLHGFDYVSINNSKLSKTKPKTDNWLLDEAVGLVIGDCEAPVSGLEAIEMMIKLGYRKE